MRTKRLLWVLIIVLAKSDVQLSAQNTSTNQIADTPAQFEAIRVKAENGDASAQYEVGWKYEIDYTNCSEAVKWYRKAANQGNPDAQCQLGYLKHMGMWGVPKDIQEAAKWYRLAADQGNEFAKRQLGGLYEIIGDGTEAIKWYREAAKRGDVTPQFLAVREKAERGDPETEWKLGRIYGLWTNDIDPGPDVPRNVDASIKWLRQAAEQGFAKAQYDLSREFSYTNQNEGVKWLREAARNGIADAQDELGSAYLGNTAYSFGWGQLIPKDPAEGVKWLEKAAEQGNAEAQYTLGDCCFRGIGTTADYVQAYMWVNLARAQGYKYGFLELSTLERYMTSQQIAQGQQLAREFRPRRALKVGASLSAKDIEVSNPLAAGTGFFITDDGYLISNNHVVEDGTEIRLVTSERVILAKVVKIDTANDLALLKAEGKFSPLPIVASKSAHLGNSVVTVGFPDPGLQGFAPKFARGEIAALSGAADDPKYFQISVPVQPGNSGGALVDEHGNVVGVVAAKLSALAALNTSGALPENVNYAVKSSFLLSFLESAPEISARLKEPETKETKPEDVVKSAEQAAVLVLVY